MHVGIARNVIHPAFNRVAHISAKAIDLELECIAVRKVVVNDHPATWRCEVKPIEYLTRSLATNFKLSLMQKRASQRVAIAAA